MGWKNIRMGSIIKVTLVKMKGMALGNYFTKIKQFMQENGKEANFVAKVLSVISLT